MIADAVGPGRTSPSEIRSDSTYSTGSPAAATRTTSFPSSRPTQASPKPPSSTAMSHTLCSSETASATPVAAWLARVSTRYMRSSRAARSSARTRSVTSRKLMTMPGTDGSVRRFTAVVSTWRQSPPASRIRNVLRGRGPGVATVSENQGVTESRSSGWTSSNMLRPTWVVGAYPNTSSAAAFAYNSTPLVSTTATRSGSRSM